MGHPDFQGAFQVAPSDTILGTPAAGLVIPATSTVTLYDDFFQGISYAISIDALGQANPAVPVYKVTAFWKDTNGNVISFDQHQSLATNVNPANGNALVVGRGPSVGARLTLLVKNYDSAALTLDATIYQSSRFVTRPDWRSQSNNISGTYTYGGATFSTPSSAPATLNLGCSSGVNIPANSAVYRVLAQYSGQAQIEINNLQDMIIRLFQVNPDLTTPLQEYYAIDSPGAVAGKTFNVTLLRGTTLLEIFNTTGIDNVITFTVAAQEFAS